MQILKSVGVLSAAYSRKKDFRSSLRGSRPALRPYNSSNTLSLIRQGEGVFAMNSRALFLSAGLMIGTLLGQQSPKSQNPSRAPQIVRVRTGRSCGWCTGNDGYHENETIIERGTLVIVNRSDLDKKTHPDQKMQFSIKKQDWEDLTRFINARAPDPFVGRIGCPGCVDESVGWVAVEFSDGTKKEVVYNDGGEPSRHPGAAKEDFGHQKETSAVKSRAKTTPLTESPILVKPHSGPNSPQPTPSIKKIVWSNVAHWLYRKAYNISRS